MPKTKLKILVDQELITKLERILTERKLNLNELIQLYIRSTVNAYECGKELDVDDEFQFGKYRGEKVGIVARAEPNYIRWLLGSERPTQFSAKVLELVME